MQVAHPDIPFKFRDMPHTAADDAGQQQLDITEMLNIVKSKSLYLHMLLLCASVPCCLVANHNLLSSVAGCQGSANAKCVTDDIILCLGIGTAPGPVSESLASVAEGGCTVRLATHPLLRRREASRLKYVAVAACLTPGTHCC